MKTNKPTTAYRYWNPDPAADIFRAPQVTRIEKKIKRIGKCREEEYEKEKD